MRNRRLLAAAGALLLIAGCSTSPTKPIPSTPLSSLVVLPASDTLFVGGTSAFTVTALDTAGAVVSNPVLIWGSSNTAVFRVSTAGVVTAVGEGTATLSVTSGGKTATALIMVLPTQRGWFTQTSNVASALNSVFFLPNGNSGWAVGVSGRIVSTRNAGGTWTQQTSNTAFDLNSVWFTTSSEGWAVGANGTILHTLDGGVSWGLMLSGTSDVLNGVTFASRDTGWAVGSNGTILRTFNRGTTWAKLNPTASALRSVSFAGTRDGWAVGSNGVIVGTHDRGLSWFVVQPALTSQVLNGVWRSSVAAANAVGAIGTVASTAVTPDSVAWSVANIGAANQLNGVNFSDPSNGWAVGLNGTAGLVVNTTNGGATWSPQVSNSQFALNGVIFIDAQRGWAVGSNGSVLHTVTGGAP